MTDQELIQEILRKGLFVSNHFNQKKWNQSIIAELISSNQSSVSRVVDGQIALLPAVRRLAQQLYDQIENKIQAEKQKLEKTLHKINKQYEAIATKEEQEDSFATSTDSDGNKIYFSFAVEEQFEKLNEEYEVAWGYLQTLNSL